MESGKLRTLMLLGIHLLWVLALPVHGHPGPNHENVIDLLAALNMSRQISGVARLHSPGNVMYRIRPRAPHLTLPREYSHFLYSNLQGSMGVHLVGHQAVGSSATLFSLSSPSSPILQIISSTLNDTLRLDYRAGGGVKGLASFHFPRRNPFSREDWVRLAVSLERYRLAFFVDCQEAVVIPIKSEEKIYLELPQDVVVTLASTPGKKDSKFSGYLKTAEISMKAYLRRPWHCDNITDDLSPSQYTGARNPNYRTDSSRMMQQDASTSKPPISHRPQDQTSHYPHDVQSDQLQRGVVLGPPGFPKGVKSVSQGQKDDRLKKLEKRLEEMAHMLDMVKAQNADLQSRVQYLEGCDCVRQRCVWEGREVEDGQRWQIDLNNVCRCTSGKVTCQDNTKDPCLSSPCQNGGVCFVLTLDPAGFHCSCPPNTKGPVCHRELRQACWLPKPENSCEGVRPFQRRWAFNPTSGLCEDFLYCTGNSSNSFPSFNACRDQCMLGACCLRKPSLPTGHQHHSHHGYNISSGDSTLGQYDHYNLEDETLYGNIDFNLTELEDLKENLKRDQEKTIADCYEDPDFTYTCDYLTLMQCQALVKDQAGEAQVVSFSPGLKCSDVRCGGGCGCFSQRKLWRYGERFRQGCEKCICTHSGRIDCVCRHLTQRKEIRDLTLRERSLYQKAVRKLYARPGCEPDGTVHNVSYSTLDGCKTCTCKGGNRECSPLPCPSLDCTQKETVPGDCCQRCRGCIHSGIQYDHLAKWRPVENPCDVCYCLEGHVRCEREQCQTPCKNPAAPPPNTCCPVCQGCSVNGHDFPNGAVIPTEDRCQECTCANGNVVCSSHSCPALSCRNPVHRAGDCCPRCEQCEYESKVFLDGQKFPSRRDPCLHCRCSAGEVSCERMDASCPTVHCSHPAKRKGECCPTCNECEYDRRVYADGKVFIPPGGGPCLQCRCKGGSVICREEKCPPVQCSNPIIDPHLCCPICKACVLEGVEYEEGSSWQPEDPCSRCKCVNGKILCTQTQCSSTACLHPTKNTGSCCAVCDSCTYNHRIYTNGQRFTTPDQACHICTCLHGTVACERNPCPLLNCTNSYTPPGECCPKCPDCSFENRVFVDGETFPNPVSVCEECKCVSGRIDCHHTQCPHPRCNAPLPGTCCQNNCNGCSYGGKEYPNGQEFPHPTDTCRICSCINGNVQCLKRRCPPLPCSNPNVLPRDCCPQCPAPPSDCVYEQRTYRHTERFYHPTDNCQLCTCTNGKVHCQRKPCPSAQCSHPITQPCCRTCEGCLYEGQERANGETWDDVSDPCTVCACREGSVRCERKRCPPSNCKHPVPRQCCMSCDGCTFHGKEYLDGTEFRNDKDPCGVCYCNGGEVVCTKIHCYGECSHPYTTPGQCCGECERCFYNGRVLTNGQSIPDPGNPCSDCTCQAGSVRCVKKPCSAARCSHPVTNPCGCPVCDGCHFQGVNYIDGVILPGGEKDCQECRCSRGEVVCAQRRCPAVSCPHPALDRCACRVCDGCIFSGRDRFNGERFPHPKDRCQHCSCLNGGVVCAHASCPSVACVRPVTPPGECCPVCRGICLHQGKEYQSGSSFTSPSDPCSSCSCLNEVVNCQRRPCPVQCSHPVPSDACCPVCDCCLYEGVVHSHSHTFTPSSDPCQRCTCDRGSVTCVSPVCPRTPCVRPVTKPGQCCPECTVCMLDGQEYNEGQTWTLRSNHCYTCTCQAGKVQCAPPECPKLPCMHQVIDPGACCPRCRGCVYGGEAHTEASSWFADSTPCRTCMCVDGVTTCSEVRCLSPCNNFINVPGECCPVCNDCVFEGKVYGPGESFHPANDPCQVCTCEVMPDGKQHLRCYRKQCPSLVDCPKSNILFSGPDSCCPVCAQPLSNCTSALIGNELLATDNPCFTCQCKDLTWTCLHQTCLPLTCPVNEQFTPPDSCCPVCKECVIEGRNKRVANGSSWTDSDDDCVTCTCNLGYIECSIKECLPLDCLEGQKPVKIPGKCCYECQESGVSCLYQGTVYHSNEQWEVDECTSCTCVSGDVHCHSQRCPPLTCATDEMPAVVPGLCCPHCLPRPATCIAFGDPHYRTFDGRMLHFQGACTYVLAQDCEGGDFSIHATNDDRGRKGVSWTKEVTVFKGDVTVQLLQDWVVKVDDEVVTLPFLREPYIYIERQTNTILLNTNIGLKVLWNGRSYLEVSVPGSYKGQTCGLCGNFNNYRQDDLRMPSGRISPSESGFGNSWRVTNGSHSLSSCRPGEDVDPCKDAGYQAKKGANGRCKVLKSAVFKPCHRVVPPEPWYGACVYDLCACGANTDECLCDTLEAYASQCRKAGVILQWRSPSLCAVGCPVERGFVFDECGPPCPVTCFNVAVPLGVIESHCFKPCVPGCQCPAGLVLHNNYCIRPEKCPKIIHGNPS